MAITIHNYKIGSADDCTQSTISEWAQAFKDVYAWKAVDESDASNIKYYVSDSCYIRLTITSTAQGVLSIVNSRKSVSFAGLNEGNNCITVAATSKGIAITIASPVFSNNFQVFIGGLKIVGGTTSKGVVFNNNIASAINIFTDRSTNDTTQGEVVSRSDQLVSVLYPVVDITCGDKFTGIYFMHSTSLAQCIFELNDNKFVCGSTLALSD